MDCTKCGDTIKPVTSVMRISIGKVGQGPNPEFEFERYRAALCEACSTLVEKVLREWTADMKDRA